jgi:hypothetical protein
MLTQTLAPRIHLMSLNDAIARNIRRWPTLYACRTDVLHQWFCVNGNGMSWEEGRLVAYDHNKRVPSLKSMIADATEPLRHNQKIFQDDPEQAAKYRVLIRMEQDLIRTRYQMADDLALITWDQGYSAGSEFPSRRIYPLCEYARMNCVPDDVDAEYLAAVREMILVVFRSDPSNTMCPHDATAEQQAAAHQANIEFADKVLQDLARRFGDGGKVSSYAQFRDNGAQIVRAVLDVFAELDDLDLDQ